MVGQKVGDPGGRELDRRVSKLLRQLTGNLRWSIEDGEIIKTHYIFCPVFNCWGEPFYIN